MFGTYLEGSRVTGLYMEKYPVTGVVRLSRVKLGGSLVHYVDLIESIDVRGRQRDSVILKDSDIASVETGEA